MAPVTPFAGDALEALDLGEREIAIGRGAHDRRRKRMLALALEARRELKQRFLADPGRGLERHDRRLSDGQRAGLVDHQSVDLFEPLERFGMS